MTVYFRQSLIQFFVFVCAIVLLFVAVAKIDNLLISMMLALVNAYILSPAVDYLERRGMNRTVSVAIPFFGVTVLVAILVKVFYPEIVEQIQSFQTNIPKYTDALNKFTLDCERFVAQVLPASFQFDVKSKVTPYLDSFTSGFLSELPNYLSRSLMVAFLTPLLTFFILLDGRSFMKSLLSLVPNGLFELVLNLQHQITSQVGGFIRARMVQSILVGLVIWLGLVAIGFQYALVLAIIGGILNVIPYLGPLLAIFPALLISFANGGGGRELVEISFVYFLGQVLDMILITPFVVAKIVNLHPVTVILVILVGGQFMGILGMIICIPIFSALKVSSILIYRHLTDFRS